MGELKRDLERGVVQEERFEYKGYPCVILFMDMGHRCGYVGIPVKDLGGCIEEEYNIACHGGITYSGFSLNLQDDEDKYWIGFDCAHYGDGRDAAKTMEYFNVDVSRFDLYGGNFKSLEFCKEECKKIVDQVIDILDG